MKILITTCGVGIGHASRELTLALYLEKKGHSVEFASYGAGLHFLRKNHKTVHPLPNMNFEGNNGSVDIEKSVKNSKDIPYTFIKTMYKEARIIKRIKPDIIISDSDYSTPYTAKLLKIPCYIITNDLTFGFSDSTDIQFIKYFEKSIEKLIHQISKNATKILIPDIPGTITIPDKLKSKTEFIGPLIKAPVDLTKDELRRKHNINVDSKVIVVTVGGSEFGKLLIENICDISLELNVDTIIIFTGLELDPSQFKIPKTNKTIIIKQFSYNLVEWMQLSDLTIALAGHTTTMELISIKKPNILIPIKNHKEQQKNIQRIKPYKISQTTMIDDKEKLKNMINTTINKTDTIKINSDEYNKFIKYNGCKKAFEIIEKKNEI
ncbi:UDP-N-acetylglucosamine--N-acetylmuramyl-(pentapeptide) pyrophosphoryl-undecaprenol N-acetylglucosamine transferase [Methanosphaera cuniculi]|uniref:UDP-N-acetylglucosamine--N-acetylmuramyl- (pentapeptide) pyrophosphoryl-undecaprenol N-acetylglucosamine transferase n=1 Tax=Methanosphaera cuniculi TaxID=1077256 RepID=UPI0026DBC1E1|nr:UDP-N-acetylglucosamine--N-acetylmuramyl-(pentapeptide) pyrophosphoryl-undecaprenol N-acetylglucosamine transferase [Methanosphaera cuniculi]